MNYSIGIFAILFMAMAHLKESAKKTYWVPEPKEILVNDLYEDEKDEKKFELGENVISIYPFFTNYTVKVGQQLCYAASEHGSVGYGAHAFSSDSNALPLNRSFSEYDRKLELGESGGDSATKYFIFDASKVGTYEIYAQDYFRGELENEYTITINVE